MSNGVYAFESGRSVGAFTLQSNSIKSQLSNSSVANTLVSDLKIDVTNYSMLTVKTTNVGIVNVDVSALVGEYYLCLYATPIELGVTLSTTQQNFHSNKVANGNTSNYASNTAVYVSEITLA